MIKQHSEMVSRERQMRGGEGLCRTLEIMLPEQMHHCRLFSTVTINQGCSIGEHTHLGETEYYWIISGEGIVIESDGEKVVRPGDLVITGNGDSHAIRNEKCEPLVFLALILED